MIISVSARVATFVSSMGGPYVILQVEVPVPPYADLPPSQTTIVRDATTQDLIELAERGFFKLEK